eukprot:jgi/Galph1/3542/GphlegSOOS_G2189.1
MRILVSGCIHGKLSLLYDTVKQYERLVLDHGEEIDLILCCGDFQAVRNLEDLSCICCPPKYRELNDFYRFYRGDWTAPKLTIFIGGNHEASNYLQELPLGGWVAPNIFYLGIAGVIRVGNLRIGGLSGIFKPQHFKKEHYECAPYDEKKLHSIYHVREVDLYRLALLTEGLDIFLSHDWPEGVATYGNKKQLLKRKPFFRKDLESGNLGNPAARNLLYHLNPKYWFSAHMHCYFEAVVTDNGQPICEFFALDKCLPKRPFYKVVDFPEVDSSQLQILMDGEWKQILVETAYLRQSPVNLLSESWKTVKETYQKRSSRDVLPMPFDVFTRTASILEKEEDNPSAGDLKQYPKTIPLNPQTAYISKQLDISLEAPIFANCYFSTRVAERSHQNWPNLKDPNEIELLEEDDP